MAVENLNALLKNESKSDLADDAHLLLGRIEFRKNQYAAAYGHFQKVFAGDFFSPRDAEARILGAQSLIAQNKEAQAESLIKDSLRLKLEPKERAYLLEAYLPILLKKTVQIETFEALAFLSQHHPNSSSREKYKSIAQDFIDSRLSQDELKGVAEDGDIGDLRVEAMFKLAMGLVHQDKLDRRSIIFRASPRHLTHISRSTRTCSNNSKRVLTFNRNRSAWFYFPALTRRSVSKPSTESNWPSVFPNTARMVFVL